ncbi:tRNA (N6-threonylcarbamoyladenosine(37)-N6)-methyltransferase TrmO [candidate division KSB1 bacterium]|nr:MAG: tRNA (N6-threonylcarbamoyladenosine(37)-N6)-methyltransferase TrmO [candidate division KSB1 bacterium]
MKPYLKVYPVGKIKRTDENTVIEIFDEYKDALLGLDEFSHIIVIYWFHKNDVPEKRNQLQVIPRHNPDNPLTGVFACRSPVRPNLIGMSVCKIISIKENIINIDSIDAFDDSMVLDLKPFFPNDKIKNVKVPEWAK